MGMEEGWTIVWPIIALIVMLVKIKAVGYFVFQGIT